MLCFNCCFALYSVNKSSECISSPGTAQSAFIRYITFKRRFYPKKLTTDESQPSHSDVVNYKLYSVKSASKSEQLGPDSRSG